MARIKLTDIAISKLKSHPEKQIEYFDRLLPAFAVRVGKKRLDGSAGGKTYIVMVRVAQPDGSDKLKRIVVGKCHLISLADAREKAREIMRAAQRGEDPSMVEKSCPISHKS